MSTTAKILSLSYDSAVATKTVALKSYFRSVRLIKNSGTVNPQKDSTLTNILLNGKCIDPENRKLYVFYIDTYYQASWIIEIDIDTRVQTVVYYDELNNIGFDPLYKIYNARVVHGRLVWTDNKNPIYQMDIERAKKSFILGIGYGQYPNTEEWSGAASYSLDQIVSNGNGYYKSLVDNNVGNEPRLNATVWEDMRCLIEDAYYSMSVKNFYFEPIPPTHPPEVTYQQDNARKINNLRQTLFQVAYRYVYMDWRKSTFSPASIVPVPQAEEETATGLATEQISLNNKLQIVVNSGGEEVRAIEVIARSSDDTSKWYLIETINKFEAQGRGNEISKTSEPAYISMSITIPEPLADNISVTDSVKDDMALVIAAPSVVMTWVHASMTVMGWTAAQVGSAVAFDDTITCAPSSAQITSIPSWITVHNSGGFELVIGMSVNNDDVISIFPKYINEGVQREGYVILTNSSGDSASIRVIQAAIYIPPVVVVTPSIELDPLDTSGMTLGTRSGQGLSASKTVNLYFVLNHPFFTSGQTFDVYWRALVNGNAYGNGIMSGCLDEQANTRLVTLDTNLASGDSLVIYLSAEAFQETSISEVGTSLAIQLPSVVNSAISASSTVAGWTAAEYGVANGLTSTITGLPSTIQITSIPSWLKVINSGGFELVAGMSVNSGDVITFFPRVENLGNQLSGTILLTNSYGETVSITVIQAAAFVPPPGYPIACTLLVFPGDVSGLAVSSNNINAESGTNHIHWSSYVSGLIGVTIYWKAYREGSSTVQGYGSFSAVNGSQGGTLTLDNTLLQGDIVTVYFSSNNDIVMVTPPSAPASMPATNILIDGFTANWLASSGASGYKLDVSTSSDFSSFVGAYNNLDLGNVLFHNVSGLTTGVTYYYRVRAYISYSASVDSLIITVTTTIIILPDVPVTTYATNILTNGFTANWNASANATGYYLDVSRYSNFSDGGIAGYSGRNVGNVLNYAVAGLLSGYNYYYRVRAYNADGQSADSNTMGVATALPPAPTISLSPSTWNFGGVNINKVITVTIGNATSWGINFPSLNNYIHIYSYDLVAGTATVYYTGPQNSGDTVQFWATGEGGTTYATFTGRWT